ncbi:hypothetical protein K438DRAFT_1985984 [Mycena galopus ATCC 62051]|nr:hypothetical protein K438DRAFT_1985984 [Mycena galopus ATCC 62051]
MLADTGFLTISSPKRIGRRCGLSSPEIALAAVLKLELVGLRFSDFDGLKVVDRFDLLVPPLATAVASYATRAAQSIKILPSHPQSRPPPRAQDTQPLQARVSGSWSCNHDMPRPAPPPSPPELHERLPRIHSHARHRTSAALFESREDQSRIRQARCPRLVLTTYGTALQTQVSSMRADYSEWLKWKLYLGKRLVRRRGMETRRSLVDDETACCGAEFGDCVIIL